MMQCFFLQDGEPVRPGVAMTDLATGLYAHGAIMAALLQRNKSGRGAHIDCNLLSSQVAFTQTQRFPRQHITTHRNTSQRDTTHFCFFPSAHFLFRGFRLRTRSRAGTCLFTVLSSGSGGRLHCCLSYSIHVNWMF